MLFQQAMFGEGPLGREICGDEAGIRALPSARDPRLLARDVPAVEHRRRGRRRPRARRGGRRWRRRRSGPATARSRGSSPRPALPAGPRVLTGRRDTSQAQLAIARPGAAPRPPRRVDPRGAQRACSATGCRAGCSSACARRRASPTTSRSGIVEYADAGALEVSAGVDPGSLPAAIEAILAELDALVDEAVPDERAREGQGVPLGRPRAADGRHAPPRVVDRRPGGAPRPRVHARRGARGRRGRPVRGRPARSPPSCSATRRCGWRSSPRRSTCAASTPTCGCRGEPEAGDATAPATRRGPAGRRCGSARVHLRMGSLPLARAELEALAGRGLLDDDGAARPRGGPLADRRPRGRGRGGDALHRPGPRRTVSRS